MPEITLCDGCTVGVCNDDWTHLDATHPDEEEDADNDHTRVSSMLEIYGWLTLVGDADQPGYFNCGVCWEIQCGGGHLFETENQP